MLHIKIINKLIHQLKNLTNLKNKTDTFIKTIYSCNLPAGQLAKYLIIFTVSFTCEIILIINAINTKFNCFDRVILNIVALIINGFIYFISIKRHFIVVTIMNLILSAFALFALTLLIYLAFLIKIKSPLSAAILSGVCITSIMIVTIIIIFVFYQSKKISNNK